MPAGANVVFFRAAAKDEVGKVDGDLILHFTVREVSYDGSEDAVQLDGWAR